MKKLLIALAACAGLTAFADTVYLKSGSTLSGSVKSVSATEIVFDSEDLGEVTIKTEMIVKLESLGDHVVQYKDETEETKSLAIADGEILADGDKLAMDNVKEIDPKPETWHGSINAAYTATRGNTYDNTGSVLANVSRRWEDDRFTGNFSYVYSKSGASGQHKQRTADRWEVEGQEDHFWSSVFYSYVNAKYERDVIAQLESRYRIGLGLGYQWLENYDHEPTGIWNFNQEVGLNWVREEYRHESVKKGGFVALRYAHHLKYNPKWNKDVECFHNLEVLPEVDDWEKFLAKADVGFETKLIYDFSFIGKVEWDFDSQPANGRKKSDMRYLAGLGYKW